MMMKHASGLPQQITRNREFHCKMRNRNYEKAYYQFRKIETYIGNPSEFNENALLPLLRDFTEHLATCLEHAESAVFYGKRNKLGSYSADRKYGILQEEYILVHFLRELHSSSLYIIRRIETDQSLEEFARRLETLKGGHLAQQGFAERVLESLNALQQTDASEFNKILVELSNRYQIGNKLFSLLQDLQRFR